MSLTLPELRQRAGYSQKEVSDILKINQSSISHWEHGRHFPRIQHIYALAELYSCGIEDIFKGSGHKYTPGIEPGAGRASAGNQE